jgi:1-acyl-sn-glycerol-3-phosphate acyltransferase
MAHPAPEDLFDPDQLTEEMLDLLSAGISEVTAAAESGDGDRFRAAERAWAAAAVESLGIKIDVIGEERMHADVQYLVAPLHEGFADVLALQNLPLDLTWIIRDELLSLPYFGEYLRLAGHIAIEPEAPRAAFRTILREAPAAIAAGSSPVVFPQGSLLGIEVSFQAGAFQLADRWGLPLLPVVLTGSHRVWDYPFDRNLHTGQAIRLEVLPAIEPGSAVARMPEIERVMKRLALEVVDAPARHYVPERDGLWEGYRFELDTDEHP